ELATRWQLAPDGMSVTFTLRQDAKFHNGTPVTAQDVKWSFDRAVSIGGFPTFQMKAGSLEKPGRHHCHVSPHPSAARRSGGLFCWPGGQYPGDSGDMDQAGARPQSARSIWRLYA